MLTRTAAIVVCLLAEAGVGFAVPPPNFNWGTIGFHPEGKWIVVGHGRMVEILEIGEGKVILPLAVARENVTSIAFTPDGSKLVVSDSDAIVRLWNFYPDLTTRNLSAHKGWIRAAVLSTDGKLVAAACSEGILKVHEMAIGKPTLIEKKAWPGGGVAFAPDGRFIACTLGADKPVLQLIDVRTGEKLRDFPQSPTPRVYSFSADGRYLAAAGDAQVIIWDAGNGDKQATYSHTASPCGIVFHPKDKSLLVAGGYESTVIDAVTGKKKWEAKLTGMLNAAAFSPDGKSIAIGMWTMAPKDRGWEYSVILCDSATGKTIRELKKYKLDDPKPKPWVGEPSIVSPFGHGRMYTFKRLPKAEEVRAFRVTDSSNEDQTKKHLNAATFPALLDGCKPIKADREDMKLASYAPWHECRFETAEGEFRFSLYLGGLGILHAPDGSTGWVQFEHPK